MACTCVRIFTNNSKFKIMIKTLTRKAISSITSEAHHVVYSTMANLFGEQHSFKQGRTRRTVEEGLYILNGYTDVEIGRAHV